MSGLEWRQFASKDDIRANDFYSKLIEAKTGSGYYGQDDGWVKVPRKLVHQIRRGPYAGDTAAIWNGFDWIDCLTYEIDGRVYARLLRRDEIAQ